jgi:3-oxoacyl-[acyl-carrier protein] reductase
MELEGRAAIVTGGTRGIGRAIALDLAANGADVALNYRKSAELAEELADNIRGMGRRALAIQADVSSFDDAQAMVRKVLDEFGRLDILINNAGMNWDGVVWKMTEEQWDRVIGVDLKGTFNYVRAVAPIFREHGGGKIVNINAVAPGLIETEMVKAAPESVREMALAEIVLGRLGLPEEVAHVVTFLCSERARHITGQVIQVDGGQYI